jgi:hypothetical protein
LRGIDLQSVTLAFAISYTLILSYSIPNNFR